MSSAERRLQREKRALFAELGREIGSRNVLRAMERVPRELFVPLEARADAYRNIPLPIGSGQTISQPYMVAWMTELLELRGDERALELGTGSGYQAAVLSRLLPRGHLLTVEREPSLAASARQPSGRAGLRQRNGGTGRLHVLGAPAQAPFDAIIVTAACPRLPGSLVEQLAVGGRLVAPVGNRERSRTWYWPAAPTRACRSACGASVGLCPCWGRRGLGRNDRM